MSAFPCLTMLGALGLAASSTAQQLPIYELGEVLVTAERPRVADEVASVDIVTAKEIARSGARTLDEAIRLLPGLYARSGADGTPLIDVRGLRTRNVLLLLNGVPLNSTFDGQFDAATVSVENIAYIKVTRGARSVLYGPGGNGGVINIVTRGAGNALDASVRAEGGFSQSRQLRGHASLRNGPVGLMFSGSWFDQDDYELSDDFEPTQLEGGGARTNSDRQDGSAFASVTLDASQRTRFGLDIDYRRGERGKPPITRDSSSSDFANRARFERLDHEALSVHAGLSQQVTESLSLRPSLYFNQGQELTDGYDDATFSSQEKAGAFQEDATTDIFGGSLQMALVNGEHGLATLALDARQEDWSANGFTVVSPGGGGGGGGGGGSSGTSAREEPFDEDHSVSITSLAAEYELTPAGRFSAVLGAGYAAQSREETSNEGDFTFLVGSRYELTPATALRASVARQIRFPTLRDLYAADLGNPELRPERTLHYELAVERQLSSVANTLELALFRIAAEDFIERIRGARVENFEEYRFQGIELGGRHRPLDVLRLAWSYTYLDSENRSPTAEVSTLQNRPEHKLAVTADIETSVGLDLRADYLYVANSYALSRTSPIRTLNVGDYGVVDLHLVQTVLDGRLRLIGRVENLLDEDYQDTFGFPKPGRQFFLGVELLSHR